MNFIKKIKKLLQVEKKQTISDIVRKEIKWYFSQKPELKEKFPDIYEHYEQKISENELKEMRFVLKTYVFGENDRKRYLEYFEENARWQELYPQEYMQLQKEYSEETWRELKSTVDNHMQREKKKGELLGRFDEDEILKNKYGDIYAQLPKAISDEEVEKYENILQDYEIRRQNRYWWIGNLEAFPKLKEKYAKEYELLHTDLSEEECEIIFGIIGYEWEFLSGLIRKYNDYVKETTEKNYATGKVEKLYKGYIPFEEFMTKYPEEIEVLIKHYGPEFDEFYFDKNGKPKYKDIQMRHEAESNLRFSDMSYFREFIERNQVFWQYVITDREYNAISDKLRAYIPAGAIRDIAGTYTRYSISYEKFLEVKELYPKEVAFYASEEEGAEDIMCFIHQMRPYLTENEIQYMI